jgi:hypothetical protein
VTHLRDRFALTVLVETGSFEGDSTSYAAERFARVITIEIRADYQGMARLRCAGRANVEFRLGDSRTVLPKVIAELGGPALFWLDAHASVGLFGDADDCPLLIELDAICRSPHMHYVLIDDAHCFIPPLRYDPAVWPELSRIVQKAAIGGYVHRLAHDVIALVPRREAAELDVLEPVEPVK